MTAYQRARRLYVWRGSAIVLIGSALVMLGSALAGYIAP